MIAVLLNLQGPPRDAPAFASGLEFGAGRKARHVVLKRIFLAQAVPRDQPWSPGCARSGRRALFNGQLHNRAALAAELGVAAAGDATLYAEAVEAWGDLADHKAIGHYCAISVCPGEARLRLARSPFRAPPLHFRRTAARLIAASTPRSLFFGDDARREVDLETLSRRLLIDFTDPLASVWQGCGRVPLGMALEIAEGGLRTIWRYDLRARPKVRLKRDPDYVEAALALLDEAVAAVLGDAAKPGILVTGGLDSASVAVSALRQLPADRVLHGFTYGPEADWSGEAPAGQYADEFGAVERLAAMHPRLKVERFTNPGHDHRHRQRELMALIDGGPPSLGLAWIFHDIFARARALGCDVMLCADMGNETFSNGAPWGFAEYFRRGRWIQLSRALKNRPADSRPLWRRFAALVAMPLLPGPLWRAIAWLRGRKPELWRRSGLSVAWFSAHRLERKARAGGLDLERLAPRSHRDFWDRLATEDGQDIDELDQALEQLYGISKRDPCAYRPLVEFCHGLPTDQYLRDGVDRWLARRMGARRLPEDQRLRREIGAHDLDWHLRIGRVRTELLTELERMEADPDIAAMIDLSRLRCLLTDFPAQGTMQLEVALPYLTALPLGMASARFIAYAKGRNDI